MRTRWAAIQLVGFVAAGIALTAPDLPRLVQDWSDATIYPWWAGLYVVAGVVAGIVSMRMPDGRRALVAPTLSVVMAAQLAGLGLVAVKHWRPSFGMGGGYAGEIDGLVQLAWVLAVSSSVAGLAALVQLVTRRALPVRPSVRDAVLLVGVGALVLVLLPLGISEGEAELQDMTSQGAFVLIYSAPLGLVTAGAAWLEPRLRPVALASCAAAAGLSALDLMTDLSFGRGRSALVVVAVVLALSAALTARGAWSREGYRQNENVF